MLTINKMHKNAFIRNYDKYATINFSIQVYIMSMIYVHIMCLTYPKYFSTVSKQTCENHEVAIVLITIIFI